jgi:hypothetical protein
MSTLLLLKSKVFLVQAAEALRVAKGWGCHIFRQSAHRWRQGCQPYAPAAVYPRKIPGIMSVRGWVDLRAIIRLVGLGKLKKSNSFGTRTGDLPACSIVPQPTTLPRAPVVIINFFEFWRCRMIFFLPYILRLFSCPNRCAARLVVCI